MTILALLALVVPALTGCLRVQVSMGVSADDRVSGQIVAAAMPTGPDDVGPQLTPPDSLAGKIRVAPYSQDGYVGTQAFFTDLSFGDVDQLATMYPQAAGAFQLSLSRSGDEVTLDGLVDLESLPAQGSDVQLTVAFPTRVGTTDGIREGDSIVSWRLPPGEQSSVSAEVRYQDPTTRSLAGWAALLIGVSLAFAAIVGGLAYLGRNREPAVGSGRSSGAGDDHGADPDDPAAEPHDRVSV
ncbi:lipoprotein [Rhodococcus rhodnii LMG 5362]|uniref:Lipoprotein n=1 Tax=Rhodococcus rhodnii LMG 5362 TaxID=1273125 RepID=R7WS27_9NOCA|nr:hypothetical protein [Rhodococcus rhodnii]EOM78142.1 lipoprotein [Rhodococcus rhodnii LMG 5362]